MEHECSEGGGEGTPLVGPLLRRLGVPTPVDHLEEHLAGLAVEKVDEGKKLREVPTHDAEDLPAGDTVEHVGDVEADESARGGFPPLLTKRDVALDFKLGAPDDQVHAPVDPDGIVVWE